MFLQYLCFRDCACFYSSLDTMVQQISKFSGISGIHTSDGQLHWTVWLAWTLRSMQDTLVHYGWTRTVVVRLHAAQVCCRNTRVSQGGHWGEGSELAMRSALCCLGPLPLGSLWWKCPTLPAFIHCFCFRTLSWQGRLWQERWFNAGTH